MSPPKQPLPPSRAGKKPVTAYVDSATHKALRRLGIDLEKSNQEMVHEAVLEYLDRHNRDQNKQPAP